MARSRSGRCRRWVEKTGFFPQDHVLKRVTGKTMTAGAADGSHKDGAQEKDPSGSPRRSRT